VEPQYLDLKCLNILVRGDKSIICGRKTGGIELSCLSNYDFTKKPLEIIQYCSNCHSFFRVRITSLLDPIVFEIVPKGENIDFLSPNEEGLSYVGVEKGTDGHSD
jgi:hypothetical protein